MLMVLTLWVCFFLLVLHLHACPAQCNVSLLKSETWGGKTTKWHKTIAAYSWTCVKKKTSCAECKEVVLAKEESANMLGDTVEISYPATADTKLKACLKHERERSSPLLWERIQHHHRYAILLEARVQSPEATKERTLCPRSSRRRVPALCSGAHTAENSTHVTPQEKHLVSEGDNKQVAVRTEHDASTRYTDRRAKVRIVQS